MSDGWQISAGYLSEFLRPAAFALAATLSALVLADARTRFNNRAATAWTLLTLAIPQVVFPLYLVARMFSARPRGEVPTQSASDREPSESDSETHDTERRETSNESARTAEAKITGARADSQPDAEESRQADNAAIRKDTRLKWRFALPLAYAALVFAAGAFSFYTEHRTADAHLYRAKTAKLFGQRERMMREYRAALALEDDAHTHKLFGMELSEAGLWQEALAEFRAAEQKGEPDDALPFRVAHALAALGRAPEAATEYTKFLEGALCTQTPPDSRCEAARVRLRSQGSATDR